MSSSTLYIFCFLLVLAPVFSGASKPEVQTSCVEHFLNGQFRTKVLPIGYGSKTYNLECAMPKGYNFPELPVETIIRSALEKPYTLLNEKRTVGYQVSDWNFLRSIVENQKCSQTLEIDWLPLNVKGDVQAFKIESITGETREFVANVSGITQSVSLTSEGGLAGVLHLIPTGNSTDFTAKVSVSPLRCHENVVKAKGCEFELNSAQDKVSIATSDTNELSFSFRTDIPNSGFLRLISHSGTSIDVRLQEGYLLSIDKIPFPVRLLADGNFHGVKIDLKNKVLQVDDEPSFSIDKPQLKRGIKEIEIRINGTVTAVRLDDKLWQCKGSKYLTVSSSDAMLRRVCPVGESSFCQCNGPASIFNNNGLEAPKCSQPTAETGFTLKRDPLKNAFFYFQNPSISQSASVVFKSDANSGLIMFGQRKSAGSSLERFQVHYINDKIIAGACLKERDQWSKCMSCQITLPEGIATNDWIRVTLFNQSSYLHLAVNDQICKLTQANQYLRTEQFYKGPDSITYLFVGGTYYKSNKNTETLVNDDFTNQFLDITAQKPTSIRGCINEIRLDGNLIDMKEQLDTQSGQILREPSKMNDLFAIEEGCEDCSLDCGGGICRIGSDKIPVCDCSGFGGWSDGRCDNQNVYSYWLNSTVPLTIKTEIETKLYQHVTKVWALLRLPANREDKVKLFEFGRFQVWVENYGNKVIIGSERDGISKEFDVKTFDERLHLISVEKVDSVFGSNPIYKLRVDSQVQEVEYEYSMRNSITSSIFPVVNGTANKFGGCLAGLYFALDSDRERESDIKFVNVIKKIENPKLDDLTIYRDSCGISDSNLWHHSSSPLGYVSDYDPTGRRSQHVSKGGVEDDGFPWLLLILAILVVLLIVCFVAALCLNKKTAKRTYKVTEKKEILVEEARPLCQAGNPSDERPNGVVVEKKAAASLVKKDEL